MRVTTFLKCFLKSFLFSLFCCCCCCCFYVVAVAISLLLFFFGVAVFAIGIIVVGSSIFAGVFVLWFVSLLVFVLLLLLFLFV